MNSIYIESKTLLENKPAVEWLDKCGITWVGGTPFRDYRTRQPYIGFTRYGFIDSSNLKPDPPNFTHTPTALEFCQGVARIMGIPEPTFGDEPKNMLSIDEILSIIDGLNDQNDHTESHLKPSYPHKTYRILESLDEVPFDTRIPMSEWIPPVGVEVLFLGGENHRKFFGKLVQINKFGLQVEITDMPENYNMLWIDGHWMRIV